MRGVGLDERTLVEQARKGDADAYGTLVGEHQELAFRAAYLITGDIGEAEDVMQEAFVKAYQSLPRFRSGGAFRPWLLKIVTNEARDRRLSSQRRGYREAVWGRKTVTGNQPPSPEHLTLASERRRYLLSAIRQLSQQDQMIISYRYLLELSESEIASLFGRPRGTVKSRLSRALKRLRETITAQEFEVLGVGVTE